MGVSRPPFLPSTHPLAASLAEDKGSNGTSGGNDHSERTIATSDRAKCENEVDEDADLKAALQISLLEEKARRKAEHRHTRFSGTLEEEEEADLRAALHISRLEEEARRNAERQHVRSSPSGEAPLLSSSPHHCVGAAKNTPHDAFQQLEHSNPPFAASPVHHYPPYHHPPLAPHVLHFPQQQGLIHPFFNQFSTNPPSSSQFTSTSLSRPSPAPPPNMASPEAIYQGTSPAQLLFPSSPVFPLQQPQPQPQPQPHPHPYPHQHPHPHPHQHPHHYPPQNPTPGPGGAHQLAAASPPLVCLPQSQHLHTLLNNFMYHHCVAHIACALTGFLPDFLQFCFSGRHQ